MAIGHSSARCWPCELRWGSFNSATSSAHKQYIRWEFSAVARTFNELLQPWWCIHCVIVLAFEVILLGDLPYKIAQKTASSVAESTRRIQRLNIHTARLRDPSRNIMWWCLVAKFVEMLAVLWVWFIAAVDLCVVCVTAARQSRSLLGDRR